MKKNLLYLFALICSMSLFTACSDDDNPEYIQDGEFDGVYLGTLDVDAAGVIKIDDIVQKVYITKTGENQIKMELKNFSFQTMNLGDIAVTDIAVIKKGASCTFTGKADLTLLVGKCAVAVSGSIEGDQLDMHIDVVAAGTLNVKVDFEGNKLAADKSSEATMLTFEFNNEYVIGSPVIDSEEKTITFMISENMPAEQLAALTPTFTISKGATVDKASGASQDFTKTVVYTVTSEDGIVKSAYRVSVSGTEKNLGFDEWEVVKSGTVGSSDQYETPSGSYGTTNPGVMTINDMLGSLLPELIKYAVAPVTGRNGKAAQLTTLYTYLEIQGVDFNAALDGMIPYVTAGSLFTGSFNMDSNNTLNSTKFGVPFVGEPVTFSGYYKYAPGIVYYDNKNKEVKDASDKCSIYAVLYEESLDSKGKNIPLTGDYNNKEAYIGTSSRIIMKAALEDGTAKADWTSFSIPFKLVEGKAYSADKKYYLAVVCSSSFEGDYFRGAPGSTLIVDDFSILSKNN